jgi:hypothetical protein
MQVSTASGSDLVSTIISRAIVTDQTRSLPLAVLTCTATVPECAAAADLIASNLQQQRIDAMTMDHVFTG